MSPSEIKKYAEKHGVEFAVEGGSASGGWSVDCWAPSGQIWKSTGTHFLALPGDGYYTRPNWDETMSALNGYIEAGFEPCSDPECDVCHSS